VRAGLPIPQQLHDGLDHGVGVVCPENLLRDLGRRGVIHLLQQCFDLREELIKRNGMRSSHFSPKPR
jgi:hypothetical protein